MLILPAIDLRGGRCVRLLRGEAARETVFSDDPAAVARSFAARGARWLHVVDLDGAFRGAPQNLDSVRAILAAVDIPVQLGGGLRDLATIEAVLEMGVARVVLGTGAVTEPGLVAECCRRFGERVAVGIDCKEGRVAVRGWVDTVEKTGLELALAVKELGVRRVIYTDVWRDGALAGPNVEATRELARASGLKVIASGGVSSLDDIRALREAAGDGVEGAILGRAIYTGAVDLAQALAVAAGEVA